MLSFKECEEFLKGRRVNRDVQMATGPRAFCFQQTGFFDHLGGKANTLKASKYPVRHIVQNKCWSILSSLWVAQTQLGQVNLYSQQELTAVGGGATVTLQEWCFLTDVKSNFLL